MSWAEDEGYDAYDYEDFRGSGLAACSDQDHHFTAGRRRVAIKDMDDTHLANTIRLRRKLGVEALDKKLGELGLSYKVMSDRIDLDGFVSKQIAGHKTMLREAGKRGLDIVIHDDGRHTR
jgi:hypothetical protein